MPRLFFYFSVKTFDWQFGYFFSRHTWVKGDQRKEKSSFLTIEKLCLHRNRQFNSYFLSLPMSLLRTCGQVLGKCLIQINNPMEKMERRHQTHGGIVHLYEHFPHKISKSLLLQLKLRVDQKDKYISRSLKKQKERKGKRTTFCQRVSSILSYNKPYIVTLFCQGISVSQITESQNSLG